MTSPSVRRVVVFDARLHVLQLIEHGEHVDELAEREQVGLGDEILAFLLMAEPLHLGREAVDSLPLRGARASGWDGDRQRSADVTPHTDFYLFRLFRQLFIYLDYRHTNSNAMQRWERSAAASETTRLAQGGHLLTDQRNVGLKYTRKG